LLLQDFLDNFPSFFTFRSRNRKVKIDMYPDQTLNK
jgi:hypothetical protein